MCNYTIHIPLETVHALVRTRNPLEALKLLNDIRLLDCNPSSSKKPNKSPTCTTISTKNIKVVTSATTCPIGCTKSHKDGVHIDKKVFGRLLGVQAAVWLKGFVKEWKVKSEEKKRVKEIEEKEKVRLAVLEKERLVLLEKGTEDLVIDDLKVEGKGEILNPVHPVVVEVKEVKVEKAPKAEKVRRWGR